MIDCAFNVQDSMFEGQYHGNARHSGDMNLVIQRAENEGVIGAIALGGSLNECQRLPEMCRRLSTERFRLRCALGIHPTRSQEHTEAVSEELKKLCDENLDVVAAVGEIGLDYDRTQFCDISSQKRAFTSQLLLCRRLRLPIVFHMRSAGEDFVQILKEHRDCWESQGGIVHSFTESLSDAKSILDLSPNLALGLNGCSLRSQEFLDSVLPQIPLERLVLETDAPYCGVKATHPSFHRVNPATLGKFKVVKPEKYAPTLSSVVKDRNEPCLIEQVAEVIASVKQVSVEDVKAAALFTTRRVFPLLR